MSTDEPDQEREPAQREPEPEEPGTMPEEEEGVTPPEPATLPEEPDVTVPEPETETTYWLPAHGALVFGDVVLGAAGGVRLCPESWLDGTLAQLKEELRPLLDLPVERLLVSHGEPVLADGRAALARLLDV